MINALYNQDFGAYWYATRTPTFLIEKLRQSRYDAKDFTSASTYVDSSTLSDYRADNPNPVPLLYQFGYHTIKGYDKKYRSYMLKYPNEEVKYGFINSLAPYYTHNDNDDESLLDIRSFGKDIETADLDSLKDRFVQLFARIPYLDDEDDKYVERDFQNVIYIVFVLLGQFVQTEIHTARGRADVIVETDNCIYIFEFKRDKSFAEALEQIENKGYANAYAADKRELIKIGVNFDSKSGSVTEWAVQK